MANMEEDFDGMLLMMWNELKLRYTQNNSNPVCYFRFLIDPRSFGATVENMYHMSCLVKQHRVALDNDERGLPILWPLPEVTSAESAGRYNSSEIAVRSARIMSLNPPQYREIIELLSIREPMLMRPLPGFEPVAGPSSGNNKGHQP